jgi:hypothetical protein
MGLEEVSSEASSLTWQSVSVLEKKHGERAVELVAICIGADHEATRHRGNVLVFVWMPCENRWDPHRSRVVR